MITSISLLGGRLVSFPVCSNFRHFADQLHVSLAPQSGLPSCSQQKNLKRILWEHQKCRNSNQTRIFSRTEKFNFYL